MTSVKSLISKLPAYALASFAAVAAFVPQPATAGDITIFAAASMKNAMDEIALKWQANTAHTVTISLAGSSQLARQIERGAPADIFISANTDWMNTLEAGGLLADGTRFDLLGNSIVLIAHGNDAAPVEISKELDLAEMLGDNRLAMALVDAVPVGIYGKAALETLEMWEAVEPKIAQADNVRAALAFVSTGEAPLGIVYATDAAADDNVSVIGTFPEDTHPPIIYPAAAIAASRNPLNEEFLEFLRGDAARVAFERQGFTILDE